MSVSVFVRSPDIHSERKFDLGLTISGLKGKLESATGIPYTSQSLSLYPPNTDFDLSTPLVRPICELTDDSKTLREYDVKEWQVINIVSSDGSARSAGEFTDTSRVEKYEISQEDYEKRNDTVLSSLRTNLLGRFAVPLDKAASLLSIQSLPHIASIEIIPGARCIVLPISSQMGTIQPDTKAALDPAPSSESPAQAGPKPVGVSKDSLEKRGTIRFVGKTRFGMGMNGSAEGGGGDWVGIEYDEPIGKNDGSVNSERYFTCRPSHGAFVRPERVQVGDYPEIDEFADSDGNDDDDGPDEI